MTIRRAHTKEKHTPPRTSTEGMYLVCSTQYYLHTYVDTRVPVPEDWEILKENPRETIQKYWVWRGKRTLVPWDTIIPGYSEHTYISSCIFYMRKHTELCTTLLLMQGFPSWSTHEGEPEHNSSTRWDTVQYKSSTWCTGVLFIFYMRIISFLSPDQALDLAHKKFKAAKSKLTS
jgi:hypothetical protein